MSGLRTLVFVLGEAGLYNRLRSMRLSAGSRVGPYEIVSALGAGGMGEVYRARDTKLDRGVAIKILPEGFAADTQRVARFQREAKTLAALNHANIAHVHGFEESDGLRALVMELVEGEDLAERIARGPIPVAEALTIARQVADALEAAHEHGIVHRDLKPANVKARPDGTVKLLDFGLAKAMEPTDGASPIDSQSPTGTSPALTRGGVLLGTAAYMSPEQARGMPVDERADIWAFGCLLYEMLTGQRAFDGRSASEALARVIEREPDWARLPASLSPTLRTYIERCLHKDPRQRVQSIGDVRLALQGAFDAARPQTAARSVASQWRRLAFAAFVAGGAIVGTLAWLGSRRAEPQPLPVSRLQLAPPGAAALSIGWNNRELAVSPDGSRVVYVGNLGTQLFVRALDAFAPVAVYTGLPNGPFVSPDGQWIGFFDGRGVLKKVPISGGPAITLVAPDTTGPAGATWAPDDSIIVATAGVETGLQRISAAGGPMTVITRPDRSQGEADHFWPEMLPGGRAVVFTITALSGGLDAAQIAVLDLQTGMRKVLVRGGSHAQYVSSGHLVYLAAGALHAVPFDLARLATTGPSVTVVPDVARTISGGAYAAVAGNGTLVYVSWSMEQTPRTLVWVDRQGRETPIQVPPRPYLLPALSPDDTRFMVYANEDEYDLWLWDLGRTTLTRLTVTPGVDGVGVWTPDGRRVIFASERTGVRNLFWLAADLTRDVERLSESPNTQYPSGVSPDGRRVIFTEEVPGTGNDVMAMELDGSRRVTPLVQSPFNERNGTVSPDGRWLSYEGNDSGRFEIYVLPFPDVNGGRWTVSTNGGTRPLWTRGGQELVYVSPSGALMSVGVARGPSWSATTPALVVKEGYDTIPRWWAHSYGISADGQRFLMIRESSGARTAAPASIIVVQNWVQELRRLVPTN